MTASDVLLEATALATQAGRDAARELAMDTRPGVVVSIDPTNTMAMVQPDGPENEELGSIHGAAVVAPVTLRPGDRVLLLYTGTKPGCIVLGRRSGDWDEWHTVGDDGEPPFTTGWGHSAGTTFPGQNGPARVMFTMRSGRVELRGRATRTSGSSLNIFVLPEPYWPDNDLLLAVQGPLGIQANVVVDFLTGTVTSSGEVDVIFDGVSYLARIQQVD